MCIQLRIQLCSSEWFVLCLMCSLFGIIITYPSNHYQSKTESEYEQCFHQITDEGISTTRYQHGLCMSTNGPDGCCLEGHYKAGICPNLGHICCTKPDPDCSKMSHNKAITRRMLQYRKEYFKQLIVGNSRSETSVQKHIASDTQENHFRPARSSSRTRIRNNFEIVEMPAHMQLDPVTFVTDALARYENDFAEAVDYLCRMLDQKYPDNSKWACLIGTDLEYSVVPSPGKFIFFYLGNVNRIRVVAYVSGPEEAR